MQFSFAMDHTLSAVPVSAADALRELAQIRLDWANSKGSQEGLTNFALATVDIFGRLANNLKAVVFHAFRTLKRSELRAFSESNLARVTAVERVHYGLLNNASIHIPAHMAVTYPQAVTMLQEAYHLANAVNVLTAALRELGILQTALLRGELTVERVTGELTVDRERQINEKTQEMLQRLQGVELLEGMESIQMADELAAKIFNAVKPAENGATLSLDDAGNEMTMVVFSKMFRSMEEFRLTRKNLLDLEPQLIAINKVEHLTVELDNMARNLQRTLSSGTKTPSPEITDALARYVRRIAVCISYHGYAAATQLVLEHNLCLSYSSLFSRI